MFKYPFNYQVIILAGGSGEMLYPLCNGFPKPLLPVQNKPLIAYQLELLEQYGFQDIIVITTQFHQKIDNYLQLHYKSTHKIKIETINIHQEQSDSAKVLTQIQDKIKSDFILLSCDVITNVNLFEFIEFHQESKAAISILFKSEDLERGKKQGNPPISCNLSDTYDICMVNPEDQSIIQMINYDNLNDFGNFQVKRSILMDHPNINIHSNLFDSHIYICNKYVINLLTSISQIEKIENFKDDFIPFLLQFQNNQEFKDLYKKVHQPQNDQIENLEKMFGLESRRQFKIHGYIQNQIYCRRVNNIKDYQQANLDSLVKDDKSIACFKKTQNNDDTLQEQKNNPKAQKNDNKLEDQNEEKQKKLMINSSIIGEYTKIDDKVQITRSIIGKECIIKENVKIINSIVMHQTTINENCIIKNSILSNNSYVHTNSEIDSCQTGAQGQVESGKYDDKTFVHDN